MPKILDLFFNQLGGLNTLPLVLASLTATSKAEFKQLAAKINILSIFDPTFMVADGSGTLSFCPEANEIQTETA